MDAELITALAAAAWPLLAIVVVVALLPTLIRLVRERGVTVKFGDFELSVADASKQLLGRVEDLQRRILALEGGATPAPAATRGAPAPAAAAATEAAQGPRTVLWVDDDPRANASEIAQLQADGWEVVTARSTAEALAKLEREGLQPAAVVSDMGRREGVVVRRTAGLELARAVRARTPTLPLYVYTSPRTAGEMRDAARAAGVDGMTASPTELFVMLATRARR